MNDSYRQQRCQQTGSMILPGRAVRVVRMVWMVRVRRVAVPTYIPKLAAGALSVA